jgi:hypothetical protein
VGQDTLWRAANVALRPRPRTALMLEA